MEFKEYRDSQKASPEGELIVWKWLKSEFDDDPNTGSCYEQFPFYSAEKNRYRPDILLMHELYGVNIISVKDLKIENINFINGDWWQLLNWYKDKDDPLMNSERQMWAAKDRIQKKLQNKKRNLSLDKVAFNNVLALPFISETDFIKKFPDDAQDLKGKLLFKETFENRNNVESIFNQFINKQKFKLKNSEFREIRQTIDAGGDIANAKIEKGLNPLSKGFLFQKLSQELHNLDAVQHNSAMSIPSGPQRIRGLAGTGKTVVIAMKAALMYFEKKEWNILVTFQTKSLYDTLFALIDYFVNYFADTDLNQSEKVDWRDRIALLPAWGSYNNNPGVYSEACKKAGHEFQNLTSIQNKYGPGDAFQVACRDLLRDQKDKIIEYFDAILIDEGQDLPNTFYQLCMCLLKEPKRIIIGWDDMQSLGRLDIRDAKELLGVNKDAIPYEFSGNYQNGVSKDVILQNCYRSPRQVIFLAHMFGLGVKRQAGFLQFFDDPQAWRDLGYIVMPKNVTVLEKGSVVTLSRGLTNSGNNLEIYDGVNIEQIITKSVHNSLEEEAIFIGQTIKKLIENEEFKPEQIAVLSIDSRQETLTKYMSFISKYLPTGIGIIDGADKSRLNKKANHIYLASASRAKGNQYGYVFVTGIQETQSDNEFSNKDVRRRNTAFSAMTRTKAWLHISGVGDKANLISKEIDQICSDLNTCSIKFQVPDMEKLRELDTEEHRKIRKEKMVRAAKSSNMLQLLNEDPSMFEVLLQEMDPESAKKAKKFLSD